jgi:hypothetical protein
MKHFPFKGIHVCATKAGSQGMLMLVRHSSETSSSLFFPAAAFRIFEEDIQCLVTQWDACLNVVCDFV